MDTLLVFLTGALSIVVQVVLLRELLAAFYGVDLIYLLALGAWLFWTALGAGIARRSLRPTRWRLSALLVSIAVVVPLDILAVRRLRLIVGGVPGAFLPLPVQTLASALSLLAPSLLLGLLFQWAAKEYLSRSTAGRTLGRAYAIESAGGVAGGLLTTTAAHAGMPNLALGCAAAATALVAAAAGDRRKGRAVAGVLAVAVGAVLILANSTSLDLWSSWNHPDALATVDSPYGRITVTRRAGQVSVFHNNALAYESEGTAPEEFAHLTMLQHDSPGTVLLISGAAAGLLRDVAQHHPRRVDVIELDERLIRLLERHLPGDYRESLASKSVHITFNDPRRAVASLRQTYDVIAVAAPEPASAEANRFFTREFFEQCRARLAPGGIMSLRLPSVENLWTKALVDRTGSIYAALRQVFADVVVLPGSTSIVLASPATLVRDAAIFERRIAARGIRGRMVTPRYVRYLYSNDRFAEIERLLATNRSEPNTDANAASYRATSLVWLSKFVPALARADLRYLSRAVGWQSWQARSLMLLAILIAAIMRRRSGQPRAVVVGIVAFAGMALETVLLLHYQMKNGVVFQDLGALLTSVMAGLALGALLGERRPALPPSACLAVIALLVAAGIRTGHISGLVSVLALLLLVGACVGAVFASAAGARTGDQRAIVAPLYAADVLGGAIGSVAASMFLIPLGGLVVTAGWAAAAATIAVILTRRRSPAGTAAVVSSSE